MTVGSLPPPPRPTHAAEMHIFIGHRIISGRGCPRELFGGRHSTAELP